MAVLLTAGRANHNPQLLPLLVSTPAGAAASVEVSAVASVDGEVQARLDYGLVSER
jgi:hypothetical protein